MDTSVLKVELTIKRNYVMKTLLFELHVRLCALHSELLQSFLDCSYI